jgi:hypothetical protein
VQTLSPFRARTRAIPSSADQAAVPPGLAEAAEAHLRPRETLRWAGHGTRLATFLALAPGMALVGLVLGLFAWAFLATEGWEFHGGGGELAQELSPDTIARGFGMAILGLLLYYLCLFARRVLAARRVIFLLTDRRLVVARGSHSDSTPLLDVRYTTAKERYYGASLAFATRGGRGKDRGEPTLFGVANVDAALAVLEPLGISAEDLRRPYGNGQERPPPLAAGETVRWSGRRGWRAADPSRLIVIALAIPLVVPFLLALRWAWSRAFGAETRMGAVVESGGLILFACLFVGPMAWFILRRAPHFLDDMLVDMFGTLAVTDRRILFVGPLGYRIDRDMPGGRLVAADLVEAGPSGRGHIALTLAGKRHGEPEIVDLPGVPDAAAAVAAMARLVRR